MRKAIIAIALTSLVLLTGCYGLEDTIDWSGEIANLASFLLTTLSTCAVDPGPGGDVLECAEAAGREWIERAPVLASSFLLRVLDQWLADRRGDEPSPSVLMTAERGNFVPTSLDAACASEGPPGDIETELWGYLCGDQ